MKIQALYHFHIFEGCFDFCEHNGDYSWSIYRLVRQNGAGSSLEDFLHIHPEIYLAVRLYTDFKEISLFAATNINCDEPAELFKHRFDLACKYGFAQNLMFHDDSETSIDVCYMEKNGCVPDIREWEQGLELFLDHQIIELLEGSQPVQPSIEKINI